MNGLRRKRCNAERVQICINLGQYAICHNIVHEYPERDPLGSHKVEEDCSTNLTPQKSNYLLFSTNT
ncbi:hypothetical protein T08_16203 [Trichinella sp. T8]|nr:hypothetical protein T08_16203 [Trichinella sp. T8]